MMQFMILRRYGATYEALCRGLDDGFIKKWDDIMFSGTAWRVLRIDRDERKVLIWKYKGCDQCQFEEVQAKLDGDLAEFEFEHDVVPHVEKMFLLSKDEVASYLQDESERVVTDWEGHTIPWWTSTRAGDKVVIFQDNGKGWFLEVSGYNRCGLAPAAWIKF